MLVTRLSIAAALLTALFAQAQPAQAQPTDVKATQKAAQQAAKEAAEKLKARQTRPDSETLAKRLVDAAAIRDNDIVLIRGDSRDVDQLEDIAIAVRQRNAFPILRIASDRLQQKLYDETPPTSDSQVDPVEAQLAATITAIISIDADHAPGLLNHVPASRIAARMKVQATLDQLMFQRNVRRVSLGRDLYPTAPTANRYTLTIDELDRAFWYACTADLAPIRDAADAVMSQLSAGNQVAITGPNGTDLKFRIQNRRILFNDGLISDDEARAGGPQAQAWLPAGEAYTSVIPGTAEGKVVCDTLSFGGREIQNLSITFKAGRITAINGRGVEHLKLLYQATASKGELAWLDIGLNPDIAIPRGVKPLCPTPAGMVSIGIGNNLWAGGENAESFAFALYLPGTTVKVDNAPLVKDGVLAPTPVIPVLITP